MSVTTGPGTSAWCAHPGIADAIRAVAPAFEVEEVDVTGPPTSTAAAGGGLGRGRGAARLARAATTRSSLRTAPLATAEVTDDGVHVRVRCGEPLDEVVLRSYCIGAAHMALGWVRSEGLAVGVDGAPLDLTIRSFGILRAVDMPPVGRRDRARRRRRR